MNGKKRRIGLLVKLSSISTIFLLLAIVTLSISSIRSIQSSSLETAILMGKGNLANSMLNSEERLFHKYGHLRLIDGKLVGEGNVLINYQYEFVDAISFDLKVAATIFALENNDYRRISTSLFNKAGNRAVDTFLGQNSAAYPSIQAGKSYSGIAVVLGKDYLTEYKPILAPNGKDVIGILFIGIEMSSINKAISQKTIKEIIRISIIAAISMVALIIINGFCFGFMLLRPIKSVTKILKDISEGEGDLTQSIPARGNDEISDLAFYFNKTLDNIKNMVGLIQYKVHALTNTSYELSVNMEKTSAAVGEISTNFEDIKRVEEKQKKGSDEVDKAIENIKNSIEIQNKLVLEQASSVNTSSSAIEEMTANIHSVNKTLIENSKHVENLSEASEHGRTALHEVVEKIQEIAKDSEGLLEINSVMDNIASQTNLLSMNASIEAAHAGEAGKGFSVVASEIRKLAESSAQQSKTTTDMLKKIKTSIDSITKASDEVLSRFGVIDTGVKTVFAHETNIRHSMEEQEVWGRQILDSISRLKEITTSVQSGSENMTKSGNDLVRETDEFINISNEAIKSMNDIVNGALKEIKIAVTHVSEMSSANNKNFEDLKQETKKFNITTGNEKKKILTIDDDENHLEVTRTFLEEVYDVVAVKSCDEALKLLYQGLGPDYILLDLMMPEIDGWGTYDRIKAISNLHNVPIAIFTSSDDPRDKEQARKMGAADYIKKPCKKSELVERISKSLNVHA